ncbi:MAG: TIGR01440 family protein [Eubacteriales bacterium]
MLKKLREDAIIIAEELVEKGKLKKGQIVVIGCSSSEVSGSRIGTNSSPEVAYEIFTGLKEVFDKYSIYMAAQCCEHLNRAIIIEREAVNDEDIVNVIPQPKAGGSFATACYNNMDDAVAVETIRADAGIDIGDTFIGMHLKKVAVPVRLSIKELGDAHVTAARVRKKFVGGERAVYNEELM